MHCARDQNPRPSLSNIIKKFTAVFDYSIGISHMKTFDKIKPYDVIEILIINKNYFCYVIHVHTLFMFLKKICPTAATLNYLP